MDSLSKVDDVTNWTGLQPSPRMGDDVMSLLARTDELRALWEESHQNASTDQVQQVRERSLRRHAVETGVLDGLYCLSERVTELLVTEGLTHRTAEREGKPSDAVLQTIIGHHEALDRLWRAPGNQTPWTLEDLRALQCSLTRRRSTPDSSEYQQPAGRPPDAGADSTGMGGEPDIDWRREPIHLTRWDGAPIAFAPPTQVRSAVEDLLRLLADSGQDVHPVVRAAWFHHQFLLVSPLAAGNRRACRALTCALLLRNGYAPPMIDRRRRDTYAEAVDAAHQGDLHPLVLAYLRAEEIGLRSELVRPERLTGSDAIGIARNCVERIRQLKDTADTARGTRVRSLASLMQVRLMDHLEHTRRELHDIFATIDHSTRIWMHRAAPPEERASWWKAQLVSTARQSDFWTNLGEGSWWTQLEATVLAQTLNYVVTLQKVGHGQTGVLAVTAFAELRVPVYGGSGVAPGHPTPLITSDPHQCVTLLHSDEPDARWPEVRDLVDRTLAAAMARFGAGLS